MIDNGEWFTMFSICGSEIDPLMIEEKIAIKPSSFSKSGLIEVPTVENGSRREFDPRWKLDRCNYLLTKKQNKVTLSDQLQMWCDKLKNSSKGLNYLTINLGYWAVIDCQAHRKVDSNVECLQFRINSMVVHRLFRLNIDLDFSIN